MCCVLFGDPSEFGWKTGLKVICEYSDKKMSNSILRGDSWCRRWTSGLEARTHNLEVSVYILFYFIVHETIASWCCTSDIEVNHLRHSQHWDIFLVWIIYTIICDFFVLFTLTSRLLCVMLSCLFSASIVHTHSCPNVLMIGCVMKHKHSSL